jgi:hypothetical protein
MSGSVIQPKSPKAGSRPGTKGAIAEQRKFIVLLKMLRAGVT